MSSRRSLITIDLDAVRHNVRRLRAALTGGARLYAVVKADGYGHGVLPTARAAREAGAAGLAVATAEEALELREDGYDGPLLVFGPLFGLEELESLAERAVDVTVVNREMLDLLRDAPPEGAALSLHLKIDSGMNRQGVEPGGVEDFLELVERTPRARVAGVMTHFACADEDPACAVGQLEVFLASAEPVVARWPHALRHAANSAAVLALPEAHLDMARAGVAVYGLSPFQRDPDADGLRPALRWESIVVQLKSFRTGESAGYGHTYTAGRDTRLALVPVGYADGLRRGLSNVGEVLIRGRRFPMVGRVSMDSFLVDVGPDAAVAAGDTVTLIGRDGNERITAEEMARRLGTINYEVTCGLSLRRSRRVYVGHSPSRVDRLPG